MPTSRPSDISSSWVRVSPISRSAVWSSAARRMIRSSAARSIRAGTPWPMLLLRGCPGGLDSELGHEGGDVGRRKRLPWGLGRAFGSGGAGSTRAQEGPEQFDGNRENGGRVVLRSNLGDGLKVA